MAPDGPDIAVRRLVRERAGHRCEYCQHPDSHSSGPFACVHIIPRALGAGNSAADLAWSCPACNGHKYTKTRARDPQTGRTVPLFNPRTQTWSRHFAWSEDLLLILGRTAAGRATVEALHINRPEAVRLRRALKAVGEHPAQARSI